MRSSRWLSLFLLFHCHCDSHTIGEVYTRLQNDHIPLDDAFILHC